MEKLDLKSFKENTKDTITHEGVISKISNDTVTVSLKGNVSCEACKAKAACGVSESNSKEIEVNGISQSFKLNESVQVLLKKDLGLKAVFWAYIFPFVLMLSVLFLASPFFKEWVAGLLAIGVLIPYFLLLYVFSNFFKKVFTISILKNK